MRLGCAVVYRVGETATTARQLEGEGGTGPYTQRKEGREREREREKPRSSVVQYTSVVLSGEIELSSRPAESPITDGGPMWPGGFVRLLSPAEEERNAL